MTAPLEVGICVNDLPGMLKFYVDGLGCEEKLRTHVPPLVSAPLGQGPDGFDVVWLQTTWGERIKLISPSTPLAIAPGSPHLTTHVGIGYLTFYVDQIDEAMARVVRCGARVLTNPAPFRLGETSIVFFRDPEGNALELVERANLAEYRPDLP